MPPLLAGMAIGANRYKIRLVRTLAIAGAIGALAWGYGNLRQPSAAINDISAYAPQPAAIVVATVDSVPQTTRSQRQKVWAITQSYRLNEGSPSITTGRLYVTYEADRDSPPLKPGQTVEFEGYLYKPTAVENPGGFDFQTYLARRGAFTGLSARQVSVIDPAIRWGGWILQQRIVRAYRQGLGDRRGQLLGGMVLGSSASQLPFDWQDAFRAVGLAHVTAASGFHVALLLGIVMGGTRALTHRKQQAIASMVLAVYLLLTGGSPSAWRATLMGASAVFATGLKVKGRTLQPLGLLLVTAVALTAIQPLWIEDIGFLLSFAATFGLMVSTAPLQKQLDFVPSNLAAAIATPLAALLWTLPLQLAIFGKVSTYFLVASLITAPLVSLAVGSGLVVGAVSLFVPALGGLLAWPLRFLIDPLIGFVTWIANWPSPAIYTGTVSILQCMALYGLLLALTFGDRWFPPRQIAPWKRWGLGLGGAFLILVAIPTLWPKPQVQIVMLATPEAPAIAIHSQGQTALINSGSADTVQYAVLPYLRSQGIRRIDRAIALVPGQSNSSWQELAHAIPIEQIWTSDRFAIGDTTAMALSQLKSTGTESKRLSSNETISVGALELQPVGESALMFAVDGKRGLILGVPLSDVDELLQNPALISVDWLWWNGGALPKDFLRSLHPKVGFVGGGSLHWENRDLFEQWGSFLYWTEESGAVFWTPNQITTLRDLTG